MLSVELFNAALSNTVNFDQLTPAVITFSRIDSCVLSYKKNVSIVQTHRLFLERTAPSLTQSSIAQNFLAKNKKGKSTRQNRPSQSIDPKFIFQKSFALSIVPIEKFFDFCGSVRR